MSTPSTPQGSPLEQAAKNNSLAAKVTFIALAHVAVLAGGLVFYGCSRENGAGSGAQPGGGTAGTTTPTAPTFTPPSEPVSPAPYADTNAIVAPVTTGGAASPTAAPTAGTTTPAAPNPALAPTGGPATPTSPPTSFEPAPTTAGTTAPAGTATDYKVQKGDTGTTIAKKHNVTVAQLKAANPTVNWNKLKIDQTVQVPAPVPAEAKPAEAKPAKETAAASTGADTTGADGVVTHTVKAHETLMSISKKYGVSWKKIRAANGLKSENIKIGDKLKIPAKTTAAAKPAAGAGTAPAEPSAQSIPPTPAGTGR